MQVGNGWRTDWPPSGAPLDLGCHDLPHLECGTEWWSFRCRLTTKGGGEHGIIVMFLRNRIRKVDGTPLSGHTLLWAHGDCGSPSNSGGVWLDRAAHDIQRLVIADDLIMDRRVRSAFIEAMSDGVPIPPDRLLPGSVQMSAYRLDLEYGDVARLCKQDDGSYQITLAGEHEQFN